MSKNWSLEELALALELYIGKGWEWQNRITNDTPEVIALSHILRGLDTVPDEIDIRYRSMSSVRLKLGNFKSVDKTYTGKALKNISVLDKQIWNTFADRYDDLKAYCREYIRMHFVGEIDNYVAQYLEERFGMDNTGTDTLCNNIKMKHDPEIYKEHAGINQKPVNLSIKKEVSDTKESRETVLKSQKIADYVKHTFSILVQRKLIDDHIIMNLTSKEWSENNLRMNYPFMKKYLPGEGNSQFVDENGHRRFWKETVKIGDSDYLLCKEWYVKRRKYYDQWLRSAFLVDEINSLQNMYIATILQEVYRMDFDEVSIDAKLLASEYPDYGKPILQYLEDKTVIEIFNDKNHYVVDDYDLLADMINNPNKYVEEMLYARY